MDPVYPVRQTRTTAYADRLAFGDLGGGIAADFYAALYFSGNLVADYRAAPHLHSVRAILTPAPVHFSLVIFPLTNNYLFVIVENNFRYGGPAMKKTKIAAYITLVFFLSGCAGMTYKQKAALIGGGICGLVGAGLGAYGAHEHRRNGSINEGGGAGIGFVSGAVICGALAYWLAEEPKPPPPPPPPPTPPPPPPKVERTIILDNVLFDFDKTAIKPDGAKILDRLVAFLKENPEKKADLEGHTDSVGTDKYNQGLSERRTASVMDYLTKRGIDASRISMKGFGETKPIADNKSAEGRAKNRRVEIKVR
jgi:outer membrane protein OmpA-like peptidoglycan-associated protein